MTESMHARRANGEPISRRTLLGQAAGAAAAGAVLLGGSSSAASEPRGRSKRRSTTETWGRGLSSTRVRSSSSSYFPRRTLCSVSNEGVADPRIAVAINLVPLATTLALLWVAIRGEIGPADARTLSPAVTAS